jgi:hypothetical protein
MHTPGDGQLRQISYLHDFTPVSCLVFDVMFVSMTDEMGGYIRPPDESGGYRMTDGIACFSQYPTIPYTQYSTLYTQHPTPNRRTKLPLSRSLNLPLSTTASVGLISFPNYQRTSRMLLPEKCVPFLRNYIFFSKGACSAFCVRVIL